MVNTQNHERSALAYLKFKSWNMQTITQIVHIIWLMH